MYLRLIHFQLINSTCLVVCFPRPDAVEISFGFNSRSGLSTFSKDDFPTPDCPAKTDILLSTCGLTVQPLLLFRKMLGLLYNLSCILLTSLLKSSSFCCSSFKSILVIQISGSIRLYSTSTRKKRSKRTVLKSGSTAENTRIA